MVVRLPSPIGAYFEAANGQDAGVVAACFAEGAHVRDEGRDYAGLAALHDWAAEARRKYSFQAEPRSLESDAANVWVTALLTGDFPGAPADLRYRFQLRDGKICDLVITSL
jgi:SnoaL-like domain